MAKKKKEKVQGVGGWLLFFVTIYGLGMLDQIFGIYQLMFSFMSVGVFMKVMIILSIIGFFLILNSLVFIFQGSKTASKWTIIALWYMFTIQLIRMNVFLAVALLVWSSIWTAYFLKSERVKNTFTKKVKFSM